MEIIILILIGIWCFTKAGEKGADRWHNRKGRRGGRR